MKYALLLRRLRILLRGGFLLLLRGGELAPLDRGGDLDSTFGELLVKILEGRDAILVQANPVPVLHVRDREHCGRAWGSSLILGAFLRCHPAKIGRTVVAEMCVCDCECLHVCASARVCVCVCVHACVACVCACV